MDEISAKVPRTFPCEDWITLDTVDAGYQNCNITNSNVARHHIETIRLECNSWHEELCAEAEEVQPCPSLELRVRRLIRLS
jgi:hypothetical protein